MNNFDDYPMESAKDGPYFLQIVREEKLRISKMMDQIEMEIAMLKKARSRKKSASPRNVKDEVLVTLQGVSAKASLCISTHFSELESLCKRNIDEMLPGCTVTNDNLWDFWNHIKGEVDNLDDMFTELRRRKKLNWKEISLPLEPIDTLPQLGEIYVPTPSPSNTDAKKTNKKTTKSSARCQGSKTSTRKAATTFRSKSVK